MLSLVTPLIETEVAKEGARGLLTNPWLWADLFLAMIVAAFFASLYWAATKVLPQWKTEQEAHRKARAEDKAADRAMMERWVTTAVASAADTAKHSIGAAQKEIGERVADVKDQVNAVHETARQMQRQLAGIAAKTGAPLVVPVLLLCFGGASPAQKQARVVPLHAAGPPAAATPAAAAGVLAPPQVKLARASDAPPTRGGPYRGRPCIPACVRPSTCEDGRCVAATRKPAPPKPGQHAPSSAAELPAWADSGTPDRPGDALLTACAAEANLWGAL